MSNVSMIDGHVDETKLKDDDIIKALGCCITNDCNSCRYDKYNKVGGLNIKVASDKCKPHIMKDALDLLKCRDEIINGLIAGQETLQRYMSEMKKEDIL